MRLATFHLAPPAGEMIQLRCEISQRYLEQLPLNSESTEDESK